MKPSSYSVIGPYRVEGELGRGGMGVVLKGVDLALERQVAIKLMSETLAHEHDVVQRFLREARAMAKISDTHVVQVYCVDTYEGRPFIAMEYVQGTDLQRLLASQGRQHPATAVAFVLAAARGLAAAHEVGLIHRDIKPANLLLNQKGVIKVTDFGIALAHMEAATRLTGTGSIVGTPGYLAPEVCRGEAADARSDLYALGVLLFELICGERPFHGNTPLSVMMQVVEHEAPDIRALDASVDAELAGIIALLLAKSPAQRMQTCTELVQRLSQWQLGHSAQPDAQPANPLLAVQAYGAASAAPATTKPPTSGAGRSNSSGTRLNLLAQSRVPLWLTGAGALIALLSATVQYWVMRMMYLSLDKLGSSYSYSDYADAIKFRMLVSAGVSVLCFVAFSLWFLRTYDYLAQVRGLRPRNAKLGLALWAVPPVSLYFSWRIWRHMTLAAVGTVEQASAANTPTVAAENPFGTQPERAPGGTLLGLWWLSFFGSLGLTAAALYVLPRPLGAATENTYALTIELFARGLWLLAMLFALMLMLRISLHAAKIRR
jgi:serine/threonine protein kinase